MPADLVEALKRNEASAFERLITQHGAMLYRVTLRMLGKAHLSEGPSHPPAYSQWPKSS